MCGFIQYKKPANQIEKLSTGIPSLDSLIEICPGTVNCIYEDENTFIHNTLLQVFISWCEDRSKEYRILATEKKVLRRFNRYEQTPQEEKNAADIKIAWRYRIQSSVKQDMADGSSRWDMLNKVDIPDDHILDDIESLLDCLKSQKCMYFVVFSLFAPLYGSFTPDRIFKILYEIRKYTKLNRHTVFLSIPRFLIKCDPSVFPDNILQLYSDLLLPNETSLYNSYLEILKFFNGESLRVNSLESYRYGIVLKARGIKVERIDIPPEETVGNSGCSQF